MMACVRYMNLKIQRLISNSCRGPSLYYVRVFWLFLNPPTPYIRTISVIKMVPSTKFWHFFSDWMGHAWWAWWYARCSWGYARWAWRHVWFASNQLGPILWYHYHSQFTLGFGLAGKDKDVSLGLPTGKFLVIFFLLPGIWG